MARTKTVIGERPPGPTGGDSAAAAAYIAALTAELSTLAQRHQFAAVVYLLDMVRLEAESIVQQLSGGA